MLPNFLIVGAAKAGTTSLHAYLDLHPDVSMSRVKEPQYFARTPDTEWKDTPARQPVVDRTEYEGLFDPHASFRGEASPSYSMSPIVPGVPARIYDAIPEAKLVYVLRDPIERIISHLRHAIDDGRETRSPRSALGDVASPLNPYVAPSRYGAQVTAYLEHFPAEQLCLVDLTTDGPSAATSEVLSFLGADASRQPVVETHHNSSSERRQHSSLLFKLRTSPRARAVVDRVPTRMRQHLINRATVVMSKPTSQLRLDADLLAELRRHLQPDSMKLTETLGFTSQNWSWGRSD